MSIRILSAFLLAAFTTGCARIQPETAPIKDMETCVTINVACEEETATKSAAFSSVGSGIANVNIYIWNDGHLIHHDYITSDKGTIAVTKSLSTDQRYDIYALANIGRKVSPQSAGWQKDEPSMETLQITRDDVGDNFPMAGRVTGARVVTDGARLTIPVRRLMSRIAFRYSPDTALGGQGLSVTGVSLRNAAAQVCPFRDKSKATSTLARDDHASASDISILNEGGEVFFYAFENCRGDLLPGNDDPWEKVPDNINSDNPDLFTYVEVSCEMSGDGVIDGEATYRFFPGSDNVSNFDLVRNTGYTITLCPTLDGLDRTSWKIDVDIWYTGNTLACLQYVTGLHQLSDCYVGEVLQYKLSNVVQSLSDYFGGSLSAVRSGMRLACESGDGTTLATFGGDMTVSGADITGIDITAVKAGTGDLWLCSGSGQKLVRLVENVTISNPTMVLSFETSASNDCPEPCDEPPTAVINSADPLRMSLYLCDRDGGNLLTDNDPNQYRFDGSPFDFKASRSLGNLGTYIPDGGEAEVRINRSFLYDMERDGAEGQPFSVYEYTVSNTGKDIQAGRALAEACFTAYPFSMTLSDAASGMSSRYSLDVTYRQMEVRTDPYASGNSIITVTNPSRLPLYMKAYEYTHINSPESKIKKLGTTYNLNSISSSLPSVDLTFYGLVGYMEQNIISSPVYTIADLNYGGNQISVSGDDFIIGKTKAPFRGFNVMKNVNLALTSAAEAGSLTYAVIDITARGLSAQHFIANMKESDKQVYPGGTAETYDGSFAGCVLFSNGAFVSGPSANTASSLDVFRGDGGIVYSPSTMYTLQNSTASLTTSTSSVSVTGGTCTSNVNMRLSGGKTTSLSLVLRGYGEVKVWPKGTWGKTQSYLCGPDTDAVTARINSGSDISSDNYRQYSELKRTYSATVSPGSTTSVIPMKSFVDSYIFTKTEKDAYTKLNGSNDFQHQYHPIDFRLDLTIRTQKPGDVYKGLIYTGYADSDSEDTTGRLFTTTNRYFNSDYRCNSKSDDNKTTFEFKCHRLTTSGIGFFAVMK